MIAISIQIWAQIFWTQLSFKLGNDIIFFFKSTLVTILCANSLDLHNTDQTASFLLDLLDDLLQSLNLELLSFIVKNNLCDVKRLFTEFKEIICLDLDSHEHILQMIINFSDILNFLFSFLIHLIFIGQILCCHTMLQLCLTEIVFQSDSCELCNMKAVLKLFNMFMSFVEGYVIVLIHQSSIL